MEVNAGGWSSSEVTVIMGQNGTGKTTFIRILAGLEKTSKGDSLGKLNVS